MDTKEQWRDVLGYAGIYWVSNLGRVRSMYRAKLLSGRVHNFGYRMVWLCKDGERESKTIHSLVAVAFIGPRPEGCDVHHINGDPSDNRASNLEYVTRKQHYEIDGRQGSHHGSAKLDENKAREIRQLYATGNYTYEQLAKVFGVYFSVIAKVVKRESWRHVSGGNSEVNNGRHGERHASTTLTADNVRQIRQLYANGNYRQKELAEMFGVGRTTVTQIVNRHNWKHLD